MKYTIFPTDIWEPLAVWQHFEGEERVYWHDTQVNRVIVAPAVLKVLRKRNYRSIRGLGTVRLF